MAMNPVVRAQLNSFKEANPDPERSDSDFFEVMSIFSVENGILGENNDPFRIHLKGEEFGIDGIAISIQGIICTDSDEALSILSSGKNHSGSFRIYQSKTSDSIDYGQISKFLDAVHDFFTDLNLLKGDQIEDLAGARDKVFSASARSNPELKCFFCTTGSGQVSDPIMDLINSNKKRLEELNIFSSVEIFCFGAKEIQEGYRAATQSSIATINFPKSITLPDHEEIDQSFIGYISADQIVKLSTTEDSKGNFLINRSLFYDNVRDFNPDSEINKNILSEISSGDHSSFVFKNNGITIVAKTISRRGDTFTIEDYQIVNGCQTTNILSQAKENLNNIFVPLRIIGSSNSDFISKVIIGTNKQNEVREDQFWALLPFMKDLEVYCAGQDGDRKILIERRDNQYRDISNERTRIMKSSDLMKICAAAFFFQPHRAARDHRGIRNEFSKKIFLPTHSVELYHVAALALYKFDYLIRTSRVNRSFAINKFYVLYSLVRKFWKTPDLLNAPQRSKEKVHREIMKIIMDNDVYSKFIEDVSLTINKIVDKSAIKTREQLRDYIRTEYFAENFTKLFFN
ncbi:AIPR family protein [Acetobacter fabarum]|uniref:AIPR family protein n=1 Tax=Acetobacter fabarum TaxID=483199 RepID=UPI00312BC3EC